MRKRGEVNSSVNPVKQRRISYILLGRSLSVRDGDQKNGLFKVVVTVSALSYKAKPSSKIILNFEISLTNFLLKTNMSLITFLMDWKWTGQFWN